MSDEHHLQRKILHALVLQEKARFADIRPEGVDSNIFTYHLKQLIREKLVTKDEQGFYELTSLGRVAGINVTLSKKEMLEQAHSVLLMALKTKEGWLLRRRLAHPMFRKVGFVHAEPIASEPAIKTATDTFKERTGLTAEFKPSGSGYVRLFKGDCLESFVHYELYCASEYTGELIVQTRNGENAWFKDPDFTSSEMIPSMPELVELIESGDKFYADLRFEIDA